MDVTLKSRQAWQALCNKKMSVDQISSLLDRTIPPDYVKRHRERISSSVRFLNDNLNLLEKRTLDLGHNVHVGALLTHLGCQLRRNVAPSELHGHESAREMATFISPDGTLRHWSIDEFDFEKNFPHQDASNVLIAGVSGG